MKRRCAVDLAAVRVARARLDGLARRHPELVRPGGDGVPGWMLTLEKEEAMADTEQVAFRLPKALVARLDDYATRLAEEQAGMNVTRTDVVRVLLTRALDAEKGSGRKRKPR